MRSILPRETMLTVVIRDVSAFVHLDEPVTRRTVRIQLTDEQIEKLRLHYTHSSHGSDFHEQISTCFLEEPETRKDSQ